MSDEALLLFPELLPRPVASHSTGLLPSQRIEELIQCGRISARNPITADQVQPASLDLRLSAAAYRVRASFLPSPNATVDKKLQELRVEQIDISQPALLQRKNVYIVPLQEELNLPEYVSGRANPKSSTGRLDIFTRLITDYGSEFDDVREGYRGRLYLEIVPLTFSVLVQEGMKLNQLRLRRGSALSSDRMLDRLHEAQPLVYSPDETPVEPVISKGLRLSVDLQGAEGSDVVGYQARRDAPPIDLSRIGYYEPLDFWKPLLRNHGKSLVLEPGEFYILASKEKVSIPPGAAAEMIPFDPGVGEFRIHYAGFFDPGFGWSSEETKGTHAVLEVRSHEVPSLLEDGQIVCRLIYEKLLAPSTKLYGRDIGSSYQSQRLTLSKHFKRSVSAQVSSPGG